MKKVLVAVAGLALLAGSLVLVAESKKPASKRVSGKVGHLVTGLKAKKRAPGTKVIGAIAYDTGVNSGYYATGGGKSVGNRFNSRLGAPLLMTGMVDTVAFFPRINTADSNCFTFFGPPDTMAQVAMYNSLCQAGAASMNGTWNTWGLGTMYAQAVGPDFLLGFYNRAFTDGDAIALDSMSVSMQGFHAFELNTMWMTNIGTMVAAIPGRNALVQVQGDPLPVELLRFITD